MPWARPTTPASSRKSWIRRWCWPIGAASRRARRKAGRGAGCAARASPPSWNGRVATCSRRSVTVTVQADGMIEVFSAVNEMGQGIATTLAQLVVDVFDVPIEKVKVVLGDTDRGNGFGSAGSRSLFTGGSALRIGAEKTLDQARELAAQALEAAAGDLEYAARAFPGQGHRPEDRPVRRWPAASRNSASTMDKHHCGVGPELAQWLPHQRGGSGSADRRGRGGGLCQRQRRGPGGQSDDRSRPAPWRRHAGHRPGAVRTHGVRPR